MSRFVFKLPDVGEGTVEAEIVAWHIDVGDIITEDQNLVDVMTDKATVEMTSPVSGRVVARHGEPGDMAAVGAALVELEVEDAPGAQAPANLEPPPPPSPLPTAKPEVPQAPAQSHTSTAKPLAAPTVRQRARAAGIDLHMVKGTETGGRIGHGDLDAVLKRRSVSQPHNDPMEQADIEEVKVIGLRRKIAQQMQASKRNIPHFTYVEEIDMTELENLRAHLNREKHEDQPKLSILPFILRALAHVLPQFPQINAHYDDDAGIVHRHRALHAGIATQTANGLMVPVVRHAETRDVWALAAEIARVAQAARTAKATREDLTGSTITITSLGALGGVTTTPVINRPEVAIIGPNAIHARPVIRDGQIVVRQMMNLSASFDHRVVDGYDAAAFIQKLKGLLEHPATIFMT